MSDGQIVKDMKAGRTGRIVTATWRTIIGG